MLYNGEEEALFLELSTFENRGIMIYLGNKKITPFGAVKNMQINEGVTYMRDYVFEKGMLKEVHFDKVANF